MRKRRGFNDAAQLLGHGRGGVERRHRQEESELFAADAREKILGALVLRKQLGDGTQQAVAGLVTVRVVDAFEEIDVPDGERQRLRMPLPALELLLQPSLVGIA